MLKTFSLAVVSTLFLSACAHTGQVAASKLHQCGIASWYNLPGNRTANGERMNPKAMTAAHKKLSFGRRVTVTNVSNGRSIVVTINDRGPFIKGRIIDLTPVAAKLLGFKNRGTTQVCIS